MDKEKRQRIERLNSIIVDGQDAEVVKKYADKWLEEVKGEVLNGLLGDRASPADWQYYYRACVDFHRYIMHATQLGQMKQEKLNEIIKKER